MVDTSGLSPKAREIVRAGRAWHRPSDAEQAHIQIALRARRGADLPSSGLVRQRWPLTTAAIVGVGVLASALILEAHDRLVMAVALPPSRTIAAAPSVTPRPVEAGPAALAPVPSTLSRAAPIRLVVR
jgi:hypothetical protein